MNQEIASTTPSAQAVDRAAPCSTFRCIMADPPWPIKWAKNTSIRTKQLDYPTMRVGEMAELPVKELADPLGCVLCMWVTNEYLPDGLALARIWGFHYEKLFTWCKNNGMGGRPRNATEHFIIATRGCPQMGEGRNQSMLLNWAEAQKGAHSEKPEVFVKAIESFTEAPRLEMFARVKRPGWHAWGNQVESDISLSNNAISETYEK